MHLHTGHTHTRDATTKTTKRATWQGEHESLLMLRMLLCDAGMFGAAAAFGLTA